MGKRAGTITALRFVPSRNMLLAASTDSTISLYRVRDWVLLRGLKGHKGRVNSVDAHPDGRVALSVGVDRMLRMWDLVAGKSVTALKLGVGAFFLLSLASDGDERTDDERMQRVTSYAGTRTAASLL